MGNGRIIRHFAVALAASAMLGACAGGAGGIGDILGSVLGGQQTGQQGGQVAGTVLGVDTRAQAIGVQQSNGQTINLLFDANTQVVFENRNYPPTALERGDRITASVQQVSQGYYTNYVRVDQSVSGSAGSTTTGSVQQMAGTVQQVDLNSGAFSIDLQGTGLVTVSMPYNASRTDVTRFQNLRRGDYVRFYGVFLNNTRVELRQFN
jgi:hypothetical protein